MNKEGLKVLQSRYKLTEEEYQKYYKTVNLFFTTGKKREVNPKIVIVAAQAGAGKSRLTPLVNEQLGYNAVISDYDMVRAMHPKFEIASRECPEDIHLALLPDADRASQEIRDYCRKEKFNFIYEGTMRGTAGFIRMAKEFKEAGYEVDLSLLSVAKLESYGSTLLRYATDLLQNNNPRWVPKSVHDESYDKFIETMREFEIQGLFDQAQVYRRGEKNPIQIYSTQGREFHDPIEAVLYGREKYREEAVRDYCTKYDIVYNIFSKKAPELIEKLSDWEELYETEKNKIEEEKGSHGRND